MWHPPPLTLVFKCHFRTELVLRCHIGTKMPLIEALVRVHRKVTR